jgi:hypothetical protein
MMNYFEEFQDRLTWLGQLLAEADLFEAKDTFVDYGEYVQRGYDIQKVYGRH